MRNPTLTIADSLLARLQAAARRRGLDSVEQLLETWQAHEDELARFASLARKWQHETAHHSKVAKRAVHPAYQVQQSESSPRSGRGHHVQDRPGFFEIGRAVPQPCALRERKDAIQESGSGSLGRGVQRWRRRQSRSFRSDLVGSRQHWGLALPRRCLRQRWQHGGCADHRGQGRGDEAVRGRGRSRL